MSLVFEVPHVQGEHFTTVRARQGLNMPWEPWVAVMPSAALARLGIEERGLYADWEKKLWVFTLEKYWVLLVLRGGR
jgi:hypothetical protein